MTNNNKNNNVLSFLGRSAVPMDVPFFDEQSPRFKTCGCCHVRIAMLVISIWDIVGLLFTVLFGAVQLCYNNGVNDAARPQLISVLSLGWIWFFIACLAVWGIHKTRPGPLLPSLVMRGISLIYVVIASVVVAAEPTVYIQRARVQQQHHSSEWSRTTDNYQDEKLFIGLILTFALAYFFLQIWFFIVFLRGYYYLKEKQHWLMTLRYPVPVVAYSSNPTNTFSFAPGQLQQGAFINAPGSGIAFDRSPPAYSESAVNSAAATGKY